MGCIAGTILGCTVAAQLTSGGIYTGPDYRDKDFPQYDKEFNEFYEDKRLNYHAEGSIYFLEHDIKLDLGYNSGTNQEKVRVDDTKSIGITKIFDIDDSSYISVSGSYTKGGGVRHTPCYGSFETDDGQVVTTEYACFDLDSPNPAHVDIAKANTKGYNDYSVGITYTKKFNLEDAFPFLKRWMK